MGSPRILLADDHTLIAEGFRITEWKYDTAFPQEIRTAHVGASVPARQI
jgi:hypothetical protein